MSDTAYFIAQFWVALCAGIALATHLRGKRGRWDCRICDGDGWFETATLERFDCSCTKETP